MSISELSPGRQAWRMFRRNWTAMAGLISVNGHHEICLRAEDETVFGDCPAETELECVMEVGPDWTIACGATDFAKHHASLRMCDDKQGVGCGPVEIDDAENVCVDAPNTCVYVQYDFAQ